MCTKRNTTIHFLSHTEKALAVKTLTSGFDHNRSWRPFEIRAYILILALTLFVVAVSAEDGSSRDVVKRIKERLECTYTFVQEDALGKKIVKVVKDWNETMKDASSKIREKLAECIETLKSEAD
ncbi:hypothetical protein EGR_10090 [Echinococcus granulosus]|uniref:8 kDa glycoprotein n=1 Tax=Echinococcus granulosus TaxID=6210 RepID=W6U1R9_ECHGR|nr:hypothetical protein EGR_10090 [Echinococcus granulosus]EUB55045.1 hypothetical protein EGR_10090 [Echinococcus granulosus]